MSETSAFNYQKEAPDVLQAMINLQGVMNDGLDPKIRHLVKLRASQINGCAFCVKMHSKEARQDGETNERLDRLVVWEHVSDFTEAERAALAWTEALTVLDKKTNFAELRGLLRQHFSENEISVLSAQVAMINLWNRLQVSNH